MEKEKLSIEQIVMAIENENITYNEETLNGAIILINQKEEDDMYAASCIVGKMPALSASIGAQMVADPKFRKMILLASRLTRNSRSEKKPCNSSKILLDRPWATSTTSSDHWKTSWARNLHATRNVRTSDKIPILHREDKHPSGVG